MGAGGKKNKDVEMKTMDESTEEVITRGPIKNRSCTDVLCFLLLFAFCGVWVGVAYLGLSKGNPMQLVYPSDSQGRICGRDDLKERPVLLFHDLTKCVTLSAIAGCPTPQVCVNQCPQEVTSLWAYIQSLKAPIPTPIPFNLDTYREYCVQVEDQDWPDKTDKDGLQNLLNKRLCPYYVLQSTEILGRCVPDFGILDSHVNDQNQTVDNNNNTIGNDEGPIKKGSIFDAIEYIVDVLNLKTYGEKIMKDIIDSWWIILLFLGGGMFISFIWIVLMRFIAGIMVWLSLFLTIGLFGVSTAYSWIKYSKLKDVPEAQDSVFSQNPMNGLDSYLQLKDTWLAFFIISIIFLAVILLMVIFLRNRIKIAIELIAEGSKAVGHIMSSLFFPMVPFLLQLLVFAWFFVVGVYLASSGVPQYGVVGMTAECNATKPDTEPPERWENGKQCDVADFNISKSEDETNCEEADCIFVKFGPADLEFYAQWYNIFGLLWGLCFMSALGEMILAGAFGSWYWTLDKPKDLPSMALISSFGRTFRYHLGTLAFGSLIIAIIKFIRLILQYIQDKLEEKGADNPIVKGILCLCRCCFWCLEKFMKFINRNAYIVTAIYGTNFCTSAKDAFKLIFRNIARVAVLDKVTDFLLLLGKLVIVGGVTIASFYVFSGSLDDNPFDVKSPKLNYYFVPVILIMIGTYFIAKCFFSVYAMAVDTVFLCFLLDLEKNDGSREKPYYMSVNLKKILDLKEKKEKKGNKKVDRI